MPRLAVGGCSFSDYRYDIIPYGHQVAKHFKLEYIHEAACAGSNYRIWRTLTNHIIKGTIGKGDIIILQYTLVDRREAWSPMIHKRFKGESITEDYSTGTLLRLTPHSADFAINRYEKQLAECHNYFTNHEYNIECFWTQHTCFAALCETKGITVRYLNTQYDSENRINDIDGTHLLTGKKFLLDAGHMNQLGHDRTAQLLINTLDPILATDSN